MEKKLREEERSRAGKGEHRRGVKDIPAVCVLRNSGPATARGPRQHQEEFLPERHYVTFGLHAVVNPSVVCNVGAPYSGARNFRQYFFTASIKDD